MNNSSKNLILIAVLILGGWFAFSYLRNSQEVVVTPEQEVSVVDEEFPVILKDERSCLTGGKEAAFSEATLLGQYFKNYERDGEQGVFNADGVLLTEWVGPEGAVTDNEAMWGVLDNSLSIRHSNDTDGVYEGFMFYTYEGEEFAVPDSGNWLVLGPSYESIDSFFNGKYIQEACK